MNARTALASAILIGMVLVLPALAPSVRAGPVTTVTFTDSSKDVKKNVPAWKDVVTETVSAGATGNFTFTLTAAASIPMPPPITKGVDQLEWWFCLQMNSSFAVGGWPQSNGTDNSHDPCEYFIVLFWDGTNFGAVVANRHPMLNDLPPLLSPVSFGIQSSSVSFSVDPSLIGSPASFGFEGATEDRGSAIVQIISPTDVVPLTGNDGYLIWDADGYTNGTFVDHWP